MPEAVTLYKYFFIFLPSTHHSNSDNYARGVTSYQALCKFQMAYTQIVYITIGLKDPKWYELINRVYDKQQELKQK